MVDGAANTTGPARSAQRSAAVFDVDRTLLPGTSMEIQFVIWLLGHAKLGPADLVRAVVNISRQFSENRRRGYLAYHGYLAGRDVATVAKWASRCFTSRIVPRLSPEGAACLADHRERGDLTVLLSGSIEPLISLLAVRLGAEEAICTRLESRRGFYTGGLASPHVASNRKAELITELARERGIDLGASYCYADHRSDLPMLSLFGHPFPTNADAALVRAAAAHDWTVRRFAPPTRR